MYYSDVPSSHLCYSSCKQAFWFLCLEMNKTKRIQLVMSWRPFWRWRLLPKIIQWSITVCFFPLFNQLIIRLRGTPLRISDCTVETRTYFLVFSLTFFSHIWIMLMMYKSTKLTTKPLIYSLYSSILVFGHMTIRCVRRRLRCFLWVVSWVKLWYTSDWSSTLPTQALREPRQWLNRRFPSIH